MAQADGAQERLMNLIAEFLYVAVPIGLALAANHWLG